MWETILNSCLGVLCAGLFGLISTRLKKMNSRQEGRDKVIMALAHDDLYRYAQFYIMSNQITPEEMKNLEHIYDGYHALGGNGTGTELYERCKELPIVEKRTKWNPYYTEKEGK